jgi:hypothetical protein
MSTLTLEQKYQLNKLLPNTEPPPKTPLKDAYLVGLGRYNGGPVRAYWMGTELFFSTNLEGEDACIIPDPTLSLIEWWKRVEP